MSVLTVCVLIHTCGCIRYLKPNQSKEQATHFFVKQLVECSVPCGKWCVCVCGVCKAIFSGNEANMAWHENTKNVIFYRMVTSLLQKRLVSQIQAMHSQNARTSKSDINNVQMTFK